jgi:hypothetical protein
MPQEVVKVSNMDFDQFVTLKNILAKYMKGDLEIDSEQEGRNITNMLIDGTSPEPKDVLAKFMFVIPQDLKSHDLFGDFEISKNFLDTYLNPECEFSIFREHLSFYENSYLNTFLTFIEIRRS